MSSSDILELRFKHHYFNKFKNSLFLRDQCRNFKHLNENEDNYCHYCLMETEIIKEDFQKIDEDFLYILDLIDIINNGMNKYSKFIEETLEPVLDIYAC